LKAALAVIEYAHNSARYIWGEALGDPTADEILRALQTGGVAGMTRWDLNNHFQRHKSADELDRALGVLAEFGRIRSIAEPSGGRPGIRYWAI